MTQSKPKVRKPEVLAKAEKWGVDLAQVRASSEDGVIEPDDVFRTKVAMQLGLPPSASVPEIMGAVAFAVNAKRRREEVAAQAAAEQAERQRLTAAAPVGSRSVYASRVAAKGPNFRLNPLGEDAHTALARANVQPTSQPPTLFASGDAPTFTASGIPVDMLFDVPWKARHALAAAPTQAEAYEIHQRCTAGDAQASGEELADDYSLHPGNDAYAARVQAWAKAQGEAAIDEDAWLSQFDRTSGWPAKDAAN